MDFYTKAKQIVDYYKQSLAPTEVFGNDIPRNGGSAPAAQDESTILKDYAQYLPSVISATSAQAPTVAANEVQALMNSGMTEAEAEQQIQQSNALAAGNTNLAQIQGSGGQAATAASNLNKTLNPSYYSAIQPAASKIGSAINGFSLNGLSPGEEAAVERSTNQGNAATGNLGLGNGTNWISNAMNFGNAFNSKLGVLSNLAGTAGNVAGVASGNGGFNPVGISLGQSATPLGTSTMSSGAGNAALGFGTSLLGGMNQANNVATQGAYGEAIANSPTNYIPNISC